ncbi:MAG TPA: peptide-methionine (S)-S-oxide reductase MsrA [Candidatus Saccharimonadales bacterium]
MTTYVLAGGCFWCLDAVYRQLKGIEKSVTGYAGGNAEDADYYKVATGTTNHAESQEITFDENIIPKEVILDMFFLIHDPTTLNRQGNDVGPQYRSAMFYSTDEQKADFEAAIERAKTHWGDSIVTELAPLEEFYPAEISHQDYYANNPTNPYCSIVIEPKIVKARKNYTQYIKEG